MKYIYVHNILSVINIDTVHRKFAETSNSLVGKKLKWTIFEKGLYSDNINKS
jgi:hypothetical protein